MLAYAHKVVRSPGEGGQSTSHTSSLRLAVLPVEQQAHFPAICMLTSFPSIPYWHQGHKTNMCCFTSSDKEKPQKDRMLLSVALPTRGEFVLGDTGVNKAGQSLNAKSQLLPL